MTDKIKTQLVVDISSILEYSMSCHCIKQEAVGVKPTVVHTTQCNEITISWIAIIWID